ncbi:hypothetical protein N7486_005049 [Penicillium sp. IBT 16267x]|nr:hypothetical protein N7486_005049 [Penicillium sp. IBT 16267x]
MPDKELSPYRDPLYKAIQTTSHINYHEQVSVGLTIVSLIIVGLIIVGLIIIGLIIIGIDPKYEDVIYVS